MGGPGTPSPPSRFGFSRTSGWTFFPLGPPPGEPLRALPSTLSAERVRALTPDSDFAVPRLPGRAVRALRAPKTISRNCARRFPRAARGTLAGLRETLPPPGGRRDRLPGPRASAPPLGDPLSPTPSRAPQDTPPGGRASSARPLRVPGRPPRPARRAGRAPGPDPSPRRRPRAGRGGDGDWAAARGRVLGREARRPLSFSAPAPLSPSCVLAPAAAEVGALSSPPLLPPPPPPLPGDPLPSLNRPLLSPPPLLSSPLPPPPPSPSGRPGQRKRERERERQRWLRGGVTVNPGLGKAAGSEPGSPRRDRLS